jgi:hypothetical protein
MSARFAVIRLGLVLAAVTVSIPAYAGGSCWSNPIDTPVNAGFVCVELTEPLLQSVRSASLQDVEQAMGSVGRFGQTGRLHYISNYANEGPGSGEVAFSFGSDGRVVAIEATVNGGSTDPIILFDWTQDGNNCSDFPDSESRCGP